MARTAQQLKSFSVEVDAARKFWESYFDAIPAPFERGSDEPNEEFIQFLQGTHSKHPQATVASRGEDVEAFVKSCVHEKDFDAFVKWNVFKDGLNDGGLDVENPKFKEYLCLSLIHI